MTQQVQTEIIADASITSAKLATGAAVANIGAGGITSNELGSSVVTPAKLSQPLTQSTALATTSGTTKDFTGIPSWVKRITVMFNGVSTNGSSSVIVQIGTGGTPTTSGYNGSGVITGSGGAASTTLSSGFRIFFNANDAAAAVRHGHIVLTNVSGNIWAASGVIGLSDSAWASIVGGTISLAGVLDNVRITTVNGTDTFDAGSVNILYE